MKRLLAFLALLLPGAASAEPASPLTTITATDDARACAPLAGGGYAVATGGGLVLVDSVGKPHILTTRDGLPDTLVHTVVETRDGIWAGTESGAALVVKGRVERVVGSAPVHAIYAAADATWIGTWGAGLVRVAVNETRTIATTKHIAAIAEVGGKIHVASADGPVARVENDAIVSLGGPSHGQALASSNGRLLVGDLEGLFVGSTSLASIDARGISKDGALVASFGSGVLALHGAQLRAVRGVSRWARGVGVLGDRRCAATSEGFFADEGAGFHRVAFGVGLPSNDVTSLATDGKRVAIATFDQGAGIFADGVVTPIRGLDSRETVNTAVWNGTELWLGTAHGLVHVVDGAVERRIDGLPSSIVRSILPLSSTRLLVGTEEGAAFVEGNSIEPLEAKKKKVAASIASPMHATWSLAMDGDGLFLGTSTGLYVRRGKTTKRLSVSSGHLTDDWVTALTVRDGILYAGTYSAGVVEIRLSDLRATSRGGGYINPNGLSFVGHALYAATMDGLLVEKGVGFEPVSNVALGHDVTGASVVSGALWVASRRGIAVSPCSAKVCGG